MDGGINGFVYPGVAFLWKSALIFGASIQHADDFTTSDETIVLADGKRSDVHTSDLLSDFRRSSSSLSSLADHLWMARIAMTGPGHFTECNYGGGYTITLGCIPPRKTDSAVRSADDLD